MTGPEDVPAAFQFAWHAHDMVAFAALFHVDARFVNRFGHYVRGIDEIIAMHQPIHATVYRDSTLENALIDSIPISEDATVLHFWSRLSVSGAAHRPERMRWTRWCRRWLRSAMSSGAFKRLRM